MTYPKLGTKLPDENRLKSNWILLFGKNCGFRWGTCADSVANCCVVRTPGGGGAGDPNPILFGGKNS